ncbi:single-stranded DNA-binding protein [Microbacterium resistens]|uniref:single-stranded DNA-binding protein n=1 Tax=Microbacterium resistens TaxID=156977 RepID=UPI001C57B505|nr:single-stranded DNA-binding protein [Microbacterium resistens]MBW1638014.1 single-stranded DNA-binding protein [Microbacterium resistens]
MTDTITVAGTIATEPRLERTPTGVSVLKFRLASNLRKRDARTGEWVDLSTNWYAVSAYRRLAENAAQSLRKGTSVVVHGRLRIRDWESKDGQRGTSADLEADLLGSDLRFGTSVYTKNIRAVEPPREATPRHEPADDSPQRGAESGAADDWAAVGVGAGQTPF